VLGVSVFLTIRRKLSWKVFRNAIAATAKISCMIYIIAAGAIIFGHFVAITRIPFDLATWIGSLNLSPTLTISLIFVGYLIGGCFLDSLAMLLLTVPIFLPLLVSLGFDPVWFGVIMIIVCNAAVITPPVGINAYVVAMVTEVPLEDIFRHILPFLFAEIVCFAILVAFPKIATFLPSLMGK
jgi:TRAP-type C4-dicarboxylate transport system permease large subunit